MNKIDGIRWSIALSTGCIECCLVHSNIEAAVYHQNLWSTPEERLAFQKKPQSLAVRICARFAQAQLESRSEEKYTIHSMNNAPYFVDHLNALSLSHEKDLVAAFVVKPLNHQKIVLSVGVDCANVQRFIQPILQQKLIDRIATDQEKRWLDQYPEDLIWFWAAKEAVSKLLKTGIGIVSWKEIEISCSSISLKNFNVRLYGRAEKVSNNLNINNFILQAFSHQEFCIMTAVGSEN